MQRHSLNEPLLIFCFNLSLVEGVFPDELKISRICPIFQKGSKDKPESCRPILLKPLISKLFDLLVFDQISTIFEDKFGFWNSIFKANDIDKLI